MERSRIRLLKGRKAKTSKPVHIQWIAVFLAIFVISSGIFAFFEVRSYYQRRENNLYLAANQTRLMESSLSAVMSRVYTLRSLVRTNDGSTDFFETSAEMIYKETVEDTGLYVKNFILAPDGIVEKIYPLEGNESLVGFDYMDETQAGNEAAIEAYQENRLVLTEPFSLKQGGTGIAARLPVYLNGDGTGEFWGLVAVTLDMDYLLEQFNFTYLEDAGIDYCLWYESADGEKVVLAGTEKEPADPVSYTMNANNLTWQLDVAPDAGWLPPLELCLGAAAILMISLLLTRLLQTRAHIRDMNAALREIAIRDNLTGCYSRHYVNIMLLTPDSRNWKDSSVCYSLAVIDVDCFKQINDTYGHHVGDRALASIAAVIQDTCDELRGDCVIRYGGDEFILLMNHMERKTFENRLQMILEKVREIRLEEAPEMRLTVSVGAVMGDSTHTYYQLFSAADQQVYLAKESGRDQYRLTEI